MERESRTVQFPVTISVHGTCRTSAPSSRAGLPHKSRFICLCLPEPLLGFVYKPAQMQGRVIPRQQAGLHTRGLGLCRARDVALPVVSAAKNVHTPVGVTYR